MDAPKENRMHDLVISNGKVWTGDPVNPRADAVAISGNRIVVAGTDHAARIGSIQAGKLADITIFDGDLEAASPERIATLPIWLTMVDEAIAWAQSLSEADAPRA